MPTIPLFRMTAPELNRDALQRAAEHLRLTEKVSGSEDAIAIHDESHVLVRAGGCARHAGVLLYVNHRSALGTIHEKPVDPEGASRWLGEFLDRHSLRPGKVDDRASLDVLPWARYTDAVVFDGRERRRVRARTDAGVRLRLNGLPVSGPRTRIRAVFGDGELPLMLHVAVWERLEHYADAELVRAHDVVGALERSMRGRSDCNLAVRTLDVRLVYAASEEFNGRPDLLAPYYLVELQSPYRGAKAEGDHPPRQLLKVPAWRFATATDQVYPQVA